MSDKALASRSRGTYRSEQRRATRHSMPAQINVEYVKPCPHMHEDDARGRFWVTTRDISRRGICFYHGDLMFYGERIRLELRVDDGEFRYVDASIMRCHRLPDGRFEIGAAFETGDPMPPAQPKKAVVDGADA